jgi:hypothetical protein
MADVVPNYNLEIMGLELERDQLVLNTKSQRYRIAQAHDEIARITVNINATETAITVIETKLKSLKG